MNFTEFFSTLGLNICYAVLHRCLLDYAQPPLYAVIPVRRISVCTDIQSPEAPVAISSVAVLHCSIRTPPHLFFAAKVCVILQASPLTKEPEGLPHLTCG